MTVHAPAASYAATRALDELRAAERVIKELERLLKPPTQNRYGAIDLFLTDPVAEIAGDRFGPVISGSGDSPDAIEPNASGESLVGASILRIVQPEAPGAPIARPLTHLLIPRWFGSDAAAATLFVDGIASVVAARTETGPSIAEADEWVRTESQAGRAVSIFAAPSGQRSAAHAVDDRVATSFIAYLLETAGEEALHQVLASYDPERRDQAITAAYHRPLGALEEAWLAHLRHGGGSGAPFRTLFRHLRPLIRPHLWRQLEVLAYMLVSVLFGLTLPLASKYLVDDVLPSGSYQRLVVFIGVLLVIYVLNGLVGVRGRYVAYATNQRMLLELQERIFAHLQRLPHRFYATAKVGDLMSRLTSDLQDVQRAMTTFAGNGLFLALTATAAAITLLALNLLLGFLVVTVVPLFAVSYLAMQTRFQATSYEYHRLMGEVAAVTQENLSAQPVIKAFGLAERVVGAYHARLMALLNAFMRMSVIGSLFQASMTLATTLGQLVVLGVGGYLVIDGRLTVGTLLAFIGLLPSLFQPVAALSDVAQTVQQASAAMDRVSELLDQPITIADAAGAQPLPPLSREIRLERVAFGYEPGRPIIHDLNLTIPAGANVAIVGPSGCGKSTVVNLLMRFYDPDGGRVCFDDHDLRQVTVDSLRGQIGLVFQDTFVFDSTVRENIAIGRPDASDAEIAAATEAARLGAFVAGLPAGYDTVLGERGVRMSGGQRQRLAIARALVRDPRILILDEATSALDAQTEREIQTTLLAAARGRTTISVTHRLTSAATADRIFVLDQGRLVEEGTHAELIAAAGLYYRLYQEQTSPAPRGASGHATIEATRLQAIPLFAGLRGESLASLIEQLRFERYAKGENIVREGDPGDRMYLIQHGQVEVVVAIDGGERRINTLAEGDFFGEMALLTGEPRTATVRTTMPTELYTLAQEDFALLLEQQPDIRRAILETIAHRRSAIATAIAAATFATPGAST